MPAAEPVGVDVVDADDDLLRIERAIGDLIRVSASARLHAERVQGTGVDLSRTELRFLARLADGDPRPVTRLADALDVSQPTASRALRRLEALGLVTRGADDDDGRVVRYRVTAKGRRVWARLATFMRGQLADVLAGLPAARRRELAAALEDLTTRMRSMRSVRT